MPIGYMLGIAIILALVGLTWWQRQQRLSLKTTLQTLQTDYQTQSKQLEELRLVRDGLLEALPESIIVLDTQQHIILLNAAAHKIIGPSALGQTLTAILRHADLDELVKDGNSEIGDDRIELHQRILRVIVQQLPPFTIVVLIDETELQRLARARREMVGNMAHELRTPITTISLLADTLMMEETLDKKRTRKMIKDISRQAAELAQLTEEMRYLSKIESGQMAVRLVPYNLAGLIDDSISGLRSLAEDKEQLLSVMVDPTWEVQVDPQQMQRVIKNLVHNAIKFTPKQGSIHLEASLEGEEITLQVKDSGVGIPPEMLSRIFERFFQGDPSRADGTGLGLAIARHIMQAHGERLWVESQPNVGTTFYLTLTAIPVIPLPNPAPSE
jgi:two-component system phosphate regulon sensor histidine kinase PhoR